MQKVAVKIGEFGLISALGMLALYEMYHERKNDLRYDMVVKIDKVFHPMLLKTLDTKTAFGYAVEEIQCDEFGYVFRGDLSMLGFDPIDELKFVEMYSDRFIFHIKDNGSESTDYTYELLYSEMLEIQKELEGYAGELFTDLVAEVKDKVILIGSESILKNIPYFKTPFTYSNVRGVDRNKLTLETQDSKFDLNFGNMLYITLSEFKQHLDKL